MSDIEPPSVRLEDGEIDEGIELEPSVVAENRISSLQYPPFEEVAANAENKIDNDEKASLAKMAILDAEEKRPELQSSSQGVYQVDNTSDLVDEDEMLCVRGASPIPFVVDRSNFTRKSPQYESDTFTIDITSPKRRKISAKRRHRKRTTPKKNFKEKSNSSDDQHDTKSKEDSLSPPQQKLHQLCKFYLQECCAKGRDCEYMHSEFPCKFFYMGLKCEDEMTLGKCKLAHGGPLTYEMLVALIRHIHTAPNDVLGKKFVELRAKMPAGEASKMLHQMQEKLQSPEEETQPRTSKIEQNFVATLKEKLYFLSEEQIEKLQQLRISKAEDLLYLTLAQLNAIGIHAIQIEAIQMSLIAGQDMDMRHIFPPPAATPANQMEPANQNKDVDSREAVVFKEEDNADQSWYEDEEQPLVIDESDGDDETTKEEDVVDVVEQTIPPHAYSENLESVDIDSECDYILDQIARTSPTCEATLCSDSILPAVDAKSERIELGSISSPKSPINEISKIDLTSSPTKFVHVTKEVESEPAGIGGITSPEDKSWKYFPPSQYPKDIEHKMQGEISSEDWDAEEQHKTHNSSKEIDSIDSPDNSEDETTTLVANGILPELPLRTPNLVNYKPALEIDAHLTYPAMEYKLYEIYLPDCEVNRPPLMDKLLKSNSTDPRLKKFLEKEKNCGIFPQTDYSFFPPTMSQCDPRLRPGYGNACPDQNYNASPILYGYLQRSLWYQELKSNLKIQINHSVSDLVRALNAFHKDPSPKKIFDLFQIECAGVLLEVMRNVGIFIDVNGNITEEGNYQQLCAPQQASQSYNNNNNNCSVPPLKPGLLGYAPPGIAYTHPHMTPANNENSFMRQAFGNDYFGNNEFQPPGSGFYVSERNFNRNRGVSDFEPAFRRPPKRNFKRRL